MLKWLSTKLSAANSELETQLPGLSYYIYRSREIHDKDYADISGPFTTLNVAISPFHDDYINHVVIAV